MAVEFAVAFLCAGSSEFLRHLGVHDPDPTRVELQFPSAQIALLLVLPTVCTLFTMLLNGKYFDRTATRAELVMGVLAFAILTRFWIAS